MEAAGLNGGMPWPAGKALPLLSSKVAGQGKGLPDPLAALRIEGRARRGAPQLWQPLGMGESAGKRGGMGGLALDRGFRAPGMPPSPGLGVQEDLDWGDRTQRRGLSSRRAAPSDWGLGRQNWQGEGAFLRQRRPSV